MKINYFCNLSIASLIMTIGIFMPGKPELDSLATSGNLLKDTVLKIGDKYGGGIIFYISDDGRHGLIAATSNQAKIEWYNGTYKQVGITENETDGGRNTDKIISAQLQDNPQGNFAAKVCADYSVIVDGKTYDDWYLPSKHELNLLYLKQDLVGAAGFDKRYYWSSSEVDNELAWIQSFYDGLQLDVDKRDANRVRAIRKF